MEENRLLGMIDSFWFNREILKNSPPPSSNPEQNPDEKIPETSTQSLPTSSADSESMEGLGLANTSIESIENYLSPCSVLTAEKLQTIFSGKQMSYEEDSDDDENPFEEKIVPKTVTEEELKRIRRKEEEMRRNKRKMMMRMKKRGLSKSLSDLEFEEIKGFEELGFVFSEEDRDSSLASILPGLQRLGREEEGVEEVPQQQKGEVEKSGKEGGEGKRSRSVDRNKGSRSNVWWDDSAFSEDDDRRSRGKENRPVTMRSENLPVNREIDMKNYLRNWAHSVAASVR